LPPGERALLEPHLTAARTHLGDEAWEAALNEGRVMSLEDAADYALSEWAARATATVAQDPSTYAEAMGGLTPREREVAALVARGLTNRRVSAELSISERTAANHVAKILRKLGLSSRTQIASWAAQHLPLAPDQ
jgi:DNA-binding NarL/FixJ family response regulator